MRIRNSTTSILKLFTLALTAACICALAVGGAAQTARKPNIILILADDLGYGEVGCYGQQRIRTPRLDRMAREGTRFTQFYAGSTVCAPSRGVLMTGLHTGHARVRKNDYGLYDEDVTVAEVLKQSGYRTGIVGKWGLGDPDTPGVTWKQGFDFTFGFLNQKHAQFLFPDYLWRNDKPVPLAHGEYANDLFTEEAVEFIQRERGGPFFLYLAYTIPHSNSDLARLTGDGMQVPSYAPYEREEWPAPAKGKAAMITRMDRDIGRVLDLLQALQLDEQTLVLFTSDNGASSDPVPPKPGRPFLPVAYFRSNGSLRGEKRDLYEGGIRVPLIARWPGRVRAGATSEQVWAMWDFLPTAAEIAGATAPPNLDGTSMLGALTGKPQRQHEYLYWEYGEGNRKLAQAVRMGDWKAIRPQPGAPLELYDLKHDASEQHNLAGAQPELLEKLEGILARARTEPSNNIKLRTTPQ